MKVHVATLHNKISDGLPYMNEMSYRKLVLMMNVKKTKKK